jgi:hypothetical protein
LAEASLETFMRLRHVLAPLALVLAAPALAQPSSHTTAVPTVTRLVKMFTELERGLADKTREKDGTALDALLDPSFEMRDASAPGVPVPRDAWIRDARTSSGEPPRIEQMAVHDFHEVAIVSFREVAVTARSTRRAQERFIVDCWKRDGDAWKLAVRYVSDASARPADRPRSPRTIDKRY